MFNKTCSTCSNCKYALVTDEDQLYCELAEEIIDEEDMCDDFQEK